MNIAGDIKNTFCINAEGSILWIILLSLMIIPFTIYGDCPDARDRSSTKVELLFDGGFFLEGPAVAPDGKVYFSDITFTMESNMQAGRIWCYNPVSGKTTLYRSPSGMANGIIFDHQGRMIVAEGADFGGRRITRTDMITGKSEIITGLYQGNRFNSPNDLAIDLLGRIYFTDPRYVGHESIDQPVMGVYRLDVNGEISLIIDNLETPNGIVVSPDQSKLYVSCFQDSEDSEEVLSSICRGVYVYKLNPDGTVDSGFKFIDVYPAYGVDGMTIDDKYNLYITSHPPNGISIYSRQGEKIGFIAIPEAPSNVIYTKYNNTELLYVTAGRGLYKVTFVE